MEVLIYSPFSFKQTRGVLINKLKLKLFCSCFQSFACIPIRYCSIDLKKKTFKANNKVYK